MLFSTSTVWLHGSVRLPTLSRHDLPLSSFALPCMGAIIMPVGACTIQPPKCHLHCFLLTLTPAMRSHQHSPTMLRRFICSATWHRGLVLQTSISRTLAFSQKLFALRALVNHLSRPVRDMNKLLPELSLLHTGGKTSSPPIYDFRC